VDELDRSFLEDGRSPTAEQISDYDVLPLHAVDAHKQTVCTHFSSYAAFTSFLLA
jgi:hypothetical protein